MSSFPFKETQAMGSFPFEETLSDGFNAAFA